jgi:hypothetical protein
MWSNIKTDDRISAVLAKQHSRFQIQNEVCERQVEVPR